MIKYFELLLDLLEIEKKDKFIQIAKIIEENKEKRIIVYHQYAQVFQGYKQLVSGDMSVEDFLQIGDFNSKILIDVDSIDSISFVKSNPNIEKESIYILDSLAEGILPDLDNIYYC